MTIRRYRYKHNSICPLMQDNEGEWVKHEDHIEMIKKLMIFYALPPDKQKSAEVLGLDHLFKEIDKKE